MTARNLCFLFLLSLFAFQIKAQYALAGMLGGLYVDIVPDTFITSAGGNNSSYYYIDINQDAVMDIEVKSYHGQSPGGNWAGLILTSLDSSVRFSNTKAFYYGDTINATVTGYVTSGYLSKWWATQSGSGQYYLPWGGTVDQFIGVSYSGSSTSFGWIRVRVNSTSITIKEHSLGSPLVGIPEFEPHLAIFPNPASDKIFIDCGKMRETIVSNELGKEIMRTNENEIDLKKFPNGLYFLSIRTGNTQSFKKIVVQH